MSEPLRILQLYPKSDYFTGAAVQLLELARGLKDRGHHVAVATRPGEGWAEKCAEAGLAYQAVPMRSEADVKSVPPLVRLLRRHRIQVVHAQKGKARTLAMMAGLFTKIPVLILNRGVSFPIDAFSRLGYTTKRVTAIVAVSESIKRGLVSQGVRADKIHVIYSGTDTARFMDAMKTVATRAPQARLLFVGANEAKATILREKAAARGLADRTHVFLYREDIPEILAASDVCVDASYAGLGITGTLREALAVETAVIGTELEGNPELITDGETGYLFPPRDAGALARCILRMIEDPGRAVAMARTGRKRVEAEFSVTAKLDRTEALYRRLLAAKRLA